MKISTAVFLSLAAFAAAAVQADDDRGFRPLGATLVGFNEVPSISTGASGEFIAQINEREDAIYWELSYRDLEGAVQQAHIHLGQRHVNGGIGVFLCTNLGNGPAGTQACPAPPATIAGTIVMDDVIGPEGQGIAAGEFAELVQAIGAGATYANVHSTLFPGGEIRDQIRTNRGHR